MVSSEAESPVYGKKYSSVVPAKVTGENMAHELTSMDLVMKLHYLRGVYFFNSNAVQGLTIYKIKELMFRWLEFYFSASGRIRRSDSGRPFIKCNDSGVRIIEARCDNTLDDWLDMEDYSLHNLLASNQVLGPELAFSPLVLIQFTWFKCGGISVGIRWAHVLGDAFSASDFINTWSQMMAGNLPPKSPNLPESQTKIEKSKNPAPFAAEPLSVKRVENVGDYWITTNSCKMETFSFKITATQLNHLRSKISGQTDQIPIFETLSAVIWKCLAKIREGSEPEPRIVTVYRNGSRDSENGVLSNSQIISIVKADFSIVEADLSQLAELIFKRSVDEKNQIEETVERDQGLSDFIVYGANLTFVDLEEAEFYGLEINGQKPIFANYTIDGVGDEGVVLVLPGPENVKKDGDGGRTVTVILPENQVSQLKFELKRDWFIA